jgi:hypothetical protein
VQLLAKRADPGLSPEDPWYIVWEFIFPRTTRPLTVYMSTETETLVIYLRDYWERKGKLVVADFLEGPELWDYNLVQDEERALTALYADVLDSMIDEIVAGYQVQGADTEYPRADTLGLFSPSCVPSAHKLELIVPSYKCICSVSDSGSLVVSIQLVTSGMRLNLIYRRKAIVQLHRS